MNLTRRGLLKGVGTASLGAAVSSPFVGKALAADDEIVVASINDATGPINIYGIPKIDSTKFAIENINANGGVLGRPLRLIQLDAQSNNQIYAQYAQKVILEDEVPVFMGATTSSAREAMRPVVKKYQTLYFYNQQYEGGVCDKFVFCTGVTPAQQLSKLVPWMANEYGKRIYTIAADYNYGHVSADWVNYYAQQVGSEVVGKEFIPLDVVDFGSVIQRIEQEKPDVIMSLLVGGNHISYYRQHAAAGLNKQIPIVSPTFGLGNEQIVLSPEEVEGLVVIYPYFQELDNETNKAWVAAWHERFGADYPYITDAACTTWNGWHLWAKAANQAGSLEREAVTEALESGLTLDSPEGEIKVDPKSHHVVRGVHIAKVNNSNGFDIFKSWSELAPDALESCDLIANPDTHTQFTPEL